MSRHVPVLAQNVPTPCSRCCPSSEFFIFEEPEVELVALLTTAGAAHPVVIEKPMEG